MSTSAFAKVPMLIGSNYLEWAETAEAFFMSQDLWTVVEGTFRKPTLAADRSNATEYNDWVSKNDKARGYIRLSISPSILHLVSGLNAEASWDALAAAFGTASAAVIYADFRELLNVHISGDSSPIPSINKMRMLIALMRPTARWYRIRP
ncbi:hypothetical protein EUX98_g8350 [Antrodiella citrinella]|uniref:DUF4219 domain-containing protein n=1 Tax=Antrodiella citrinella TaxID=2447956 RepID=A0A4S4MAM0_9APHY|nr:hypothetical protein EUX98_g8350 [Antrodiella citrinella]